MMGYKHERKITLKRVVREILPKRKLLPFSMHFFLALNTKKPTQVNTQSAHVEEFHFLPSVHVQVSRDVTVLVRGYNAGGCAFSELAKG